MLKIQNKTINILDINYFNILEVLGFDEDSFKDVGFITQVGGGIAEVVGLYDVKAGEMVILGGKGMTGLVVTLEVNRVLIIIFGNDRDLFEGEWVSRTGNLMSVPVHKIMANAVLDPLGNFLQLFEDSWRYSQSLTKSKLKERKAIDGKAYGIIKRQPVNEPVQTGIQVIDSLIPIGGGQRELIIGDRQTGKSAIAVDTIINQTRQNSGMWWFYVAIGQKKDGIIQIIKKLRTFGCFSRGSVILTSAEEPASLQYLAPYAGCTLGEWFCSKGAKVLVVYDDLSKQAVAYRQMSLLLRRPSGREAYPGDIFYLHARLLERACKLNITCGGGSLTALPIIETQAGDVAAFIPTNVISITDGQIYLDPDLFNRGIRPAVNVGISVSRVGSKAQVNTVKSMAGKLKLELAQFKEIEMVLKFGADNLDEATIRTMNRGFRLIELLKQIHSDPLSVRDQVLLVHNGVYGWLDLIAKEDVAEYKTWLLKYIKTTNLFYEFDIKAKLDVETFNQVSKIAISKFINYKKTN